MLRTFPGISSRAWEHPADRAALVTLRNLKGFDTVLKALSALLRERQHRLLYLASAVRVDERQFAQLHRMRADCVRVLDSPLTPEIYVAQDPQVNAMTIGMDTPFIVVSTGLLDLMDQDEMHFVIGHELGHALSGHAVYRTMLMHLLRLASGLGWIPIGGWALRALVAALMEWQRKSELSADRAGLLCVQNPEVALRANMKTAGGTRLADMDSQRFLAQAAEYERTGDLRDGVLKLLNLELQTHPFSVLRAADLDRWVLRGEYGTVMSGAYPLRADDARASAAAEMRDAARGYKQNFDASVDPLISTLRDFGGSAVNTVGQGVTDVATGVGRKFDEWRRNAARKADSGPEPDSAPDGDGER
jgi:Zn-dependent protease with chaperone function